jgi:ABC-type glutathione transport system ATPase component
VAMSCDPELLFLDEPTSNLDSTSEKPLLELLMRIHQDRGTSLVIVTHSLPIAMQICDSLLVMHSGLVLEQGGALDLFERAVHPYTQELFYLTGHLQNKAPTYVAKDSRSLRTKDWNQRPHIPSLEHCGISKEHVYRPIWQGNERETWPQDWWTP